MTGERTGSLPRRLCSDAVESPRFTFAVHGERLAIARLDAASPVPHWARGGFVSVTRTAAELSIVCAQTNVPADLLQVRDKLALGIEGSVPLTSVGIMASLCTALAAVGVSVFTIATYDTDWFLISAEQFETARAALEGLGHRVQGALPAR